LFSHFGCDWNPPNHFSLFYFYFKFWISLFGEILPVKEGWLLLWMGAAWVYVWYWCEYWYWRTYPSGIQPEENTHLIISFIAWWKRTGLDDKHLANRNHHLLLQAIVFVHHQSHPLMNEIAYVVQGLVIHMDELEKFFGMNWVFFSVDTSPKRNWFKMKLFHTCYVIT